MCPYTTETGGTIVVIIKFNGIFRMLLVIRFLFLFFNQTGKLKQDEHPKKQGTQPVGQQKYKRVPTSCSLAG